MSGLLQHRLTVASALFGIPQTDFPWHPCLSPQLPEGFMRTAPWPIFSRVMAKPERRPRIFSKIIITASIPRQWITLMVRLFEVKGDFDCDGAQDDKVNVIQVYYADPDGLAPPSGQTYGDQKSIYRRAEPEGTITLAGRRKLPDDNSLE